VWLSKLVIHNLYSFGEGVVCLFENADNLSNHIQDKVIVFGRNNDEPGMDSNGSGKSSLLNVIFWIFFGEIFQDERVDEIVRRGTKKGWAELTLRDDQNVLVIKRTKGAKDHLVVTWNGEDKTPNMTATNAQKELLKILNMDLQAKIGEHTVDFLNTTYFSTATVKSIMDKRTKSKERFDIVARFLKLKDYDVASKLAKTKKDEILDGISSSLENINNKQQFLEQHAVKGYEDRIASIEANALVILNGEIIGLDNQIASEESRLIIEEVVPNLERRIANTKSQANNQLSSLQESFQNNALQLPELNTKINEYYLLKSTVDGEAKTQPVNNNRMTIINSEVTTVNNKNLELVTSRGTLLSQKNTITSQLQKHLTCPKCQEALMFDGKALKPIDKVSLTSQLEELNSKEVEINNQITKNNTIIESYNKEITELRAVINQIQNNANTLSRLDTPEKINEKINAIQNRNTQLLKDAEAVNTITKETLDELNKELATAQERVKSLPPSGVNIHDLKVSRETKQFKVKELNKEIGSLQQLITQINQVKAAVEELQKSVGDKKQEAEIYSFWENGFREIKIKIIEEFLPALEDRVNDYLETLKVNMRVDFDTKRAKANTSKKDLAEGMGYKEEFNITVLKSETVSPFNMLSQGERGRVATCVGIALRELTRESGACPFDFLLIDEIADALDQTGLQELLKLMDDIHGQKLVISHSDVLKEQFDQAILVEITDGVSTITNQAF
jgi:DNA repair exonuclease SbcCD ATPase subunit